MKTLDDVRAKYPHLGVMACALRPGDRMTIQFFDKTGAVVGEFVGATEAEAIGEAFGDEDEKPAPPAATPSPPTTSVFD